MKFRSITWGIIAVMMVIGALGIASTQTCTPQAISDSQFLMGTLVELRIFGSQKAMDAAFQHVQHLDQMMSRTLEGSQIYEINRQAGQDWVTVSTDTFQVIQTALQYAKLTDGLFDPTVAPLVDLWGIGTSHAHIPEAKALQDARALIDYRAVELDTKAKRVRLPSPGMGLDLGGIAKGYAADTTTKLLRSQGVKSGFLSLGGNVSVIGSKPDGSPWRIGIQDPFAPRGTHAAVLEVKDTSIVTSGPYERYFMRNNKRYHHILDPTTGFPVENGLASVSIVTPCSMTADALSTGVFLLGRERGLALLEELEGVEGLLITDDRHIYVTSGLQHQLKSLSEGFELHEAE
ncbi:MAG: FAD:protein FMN transferase [Firmicutes bacterium]|nr:FAD:protein FMN transferase [Bacillota bacterium]